MSDTGKLKLTKQQRAALFAGECPSISGEGLPTVAAGFVYPLSSRLTLCVDRVDVKGGRWSLRYTVVDRRDTVRLLKRVPTTPTRDLETPREQPTADEIARAAEESAYTSRASSALGDEPEAVDAVTQARFAREARERDVVSTRRLSERIRALEDADENLSPYLSAIERRVRAAENARKRRAA